MERLRENLDFIGKFKIFLMGNFGEEVVGGSGWNAWFIRDCGDLRRWDVWKMMVRDDNNSRNKNNWHIYKYVKSRYNMENNVILLMLHFFWDCFIKERLKENSRCKVIKFVSCLIYVLSESKGMIKIWKKLKKFCQSYDFI